MKYETVRDDDGRMLILKVQDRQITVDELKTAMVCKRIISCQDDCQDYEICTGLLERRKER